MSEIQGQTRQMLADLLGLNETFLGEISQSVGDIFRDAMSTNDQIFRDAMSTNDQIFRDIFGEGMDTMFRRHPALRERAASRPVRRDPPTSPPRLIEEGAIVAELLEDEPRMHDGSYGRSVSDVIEAEIVTETVDRGAQIMRQTGAAARATAHLSRPRPSATELAAQAIEDMDTEQEAIIAEYRAKLEETMAYIRGKV